MPNKNGPGRLLRPRAGDLPAMEAMEYRNAWKTADYIGIGRFFRRLTSSRPCP
jgi:hypothetical protein